MSKAQILRKLAAYKKNPDLIREVSNTELADLVLVVMRAVEMIDQSIKEGRLDGYTPKADKDYVSKTTALKYLNDAIKEMMAKTDATLSETSTELEKRVQQAIQNIRDGQDGIVTEAEIIRAAETAATLIQLPDFEAMMTEAIQGNGSLVRDALESLPEGEEQLAQGAVQGLLPALEELRSRIEGLAVRSGGTIGKNQVYNFIQQAVADGTIPAGGGGSSTFTALIDTPAAYTSQGGKLVRVNTAEDALEFIDPPSGTGDVSGPTSAINERIAVFDGVTGKLIKDGGATVAAIRANTTNVTAAGALMDSEVTNLAQVKAFDSADYATAAQGALADSASQPGHTHTASEVSDFDAEVANNSAVAANTAKVTNATHTGDVTGATALTITNDAVTNAKLANMAVSTIKGRATSGTGDPEDLTATQVRTILNVADGAEANTVDSVNSQTGAVVLDADDIDDTATTNKFVTASDLTTLSNTSGTNTGDEVSATTSTEGIVELATTAEAEAGTDTARAVTPAGLQAGIDQHAADVDAHDAGINAQTGTTYTLVLGDIRKTIRSTNAAANTVTVPPNSSVAFPVGTKIMITQGGAGSTTIAAGSGVTIDAPASVTLAIDEINGSRGLIKYAENSWTLI